MVVSSTVVALARAVDHFGIAVTSLAILTTKVILPHTAVGNLGIAPHAQALVAHHRRVTDASTSLLRTTSFLPTGTATN